MKRLYYLGKPGDGYGWGIANTNLVKELSKLCNVVVDDSKRDAFDAPVFVPVADSSLEPIRKVKAPRTLGYCFTEWPLTDKAKVNARQYDTLFAGSTWNAEQLTKAGIKRVQTLIQGVDMERFTPQPQSERKGFVVFSGGKFEYRKGQDLVIAAMRHFMKQRGDVILMCSWHNPWPQSMASMVNSSFIDPKEPMKDLPQNRVIDLPPIPNEKMPSVYAQAHLGLFPNRCEAGTNLVMSEFIACSRPVIASYATGQKDVLGDGALKLSNGSYDPAGWFNPNVSDIIAHLEYAYQRRSELEDRGEQCRAMVERFSWKACAEKIVAAAFPEQVPASEIAQPLPLKRLPEW